MKKIILIIFIILSIIRLQAFDLLNDRSSDVSADVTSNALKLDIATAINYGLKFNLSLKNSDIDLNNKKLSLATTWNQFIPNTSLSASIGRSENTQTILNSRSTTTSNSLNVGFRTSLSINTQMFLNIYQSVLDYNSGLLTLEQVKKKLSNDIEKNYYNLVLIKEEINLQEREVANLKTRYESNLIKFNSQMISEIEKLKSEYDYKSQIPQLDILRNNYASSLLSFKQIIGINNDREIELVNSIPDVKTIDYNKLSKQSILNNYDIQALIQKLKTDENTRNSYIASLTPSLSLSYSLNSSFNKDSLTNYWFNDLNNDWDKTSSFGVSVSIPIDTYFPFSSVQTGLIKSVNNAKISSNNLQDEIQKKKIEVITSIMNLQQIENSYSSLNVNLEIAKKTYQMQEQLYNYQSKNYLDLKDVENTLIDANLKLLNAKYNYLTNYLDLLYNLNINEIK